MGWGRSGKRREDGVGGGEDRRPGGGDMGRGVEEQSLREGGA